MVSRDFWSKQRVFITGHTGCKGAWLSAWLHTLGATLCGYSLPAPTSPNLYESAGLADVFSSAVIADIRDEETLRTQLQEFAPTIILHLAAQSLVLRSYAEPEDTFSTNILGTAKVLLASRALPSLRAIVVVTSDKCYDTQTGPGPYTEADPLGGLDPYSASKACAEIVTSSIVHSYFSAREYNAHRVAVATARAGNIICGGDWAENRLIPDCARSFLGGLPVEIRNPDAIRPWQHVLEPLHGYLLLAQGLCEQGVEFSGAWNFGPPQAAHRPVREVAEVLASKWFTAATTKIVATSHPAESPALRLDSSRATITLGWQNRWSLEQSLAAVSSWFETYAHHGDDFSIIREKTLTQIRAFEKAPPLTAI